MNIEHAIYNKANRGYNVMYRIMAYLKLWKGSFPYIESLFFAGWVRDRLVKPIPYLNLGRKNMKCRIL